MDGKTHAAVTLGLILPSGVLGLATTGDLALGLASVAGCALGLIMEPDLDQDGITGSEWRLLRGKVTWPLGIVWFALWFPYAKVFPHRSFWTHFPLVGTAVRLAYLVAIIGLLVSVLGFYELALDWAESIPSLIWVYLYMGLATADMGHWVADWALWKRIRTA